jgi:hypothetical protein
MAEKAVDQSREVNDRSKDALDASVVTLERTLDAAGQGAVGFGRLSLDGAIASSRPVRIQTRGNASPESFAHRPGCGGPLSVPSVEVEHVRSYIRADEYGGREWIDNSCETCGHKLSLEEMGRRVVN